MIYGSVSKGFIGSAVTVEVDLKRGIPSTVVTGLPRGALLEAVDRIRSAIRNCGFEYPYQRILINLSPAGIVKSGTSFDLAIALGILEQSGVLPIDGQSILALGELKLSGEILPVEGVLNAILSLRDSMDYILIPQNTVKKNFLDDPKIVEVASLFDAVNFLSNSDNKQLMSTSCKKEEIKTIEFNTLAQKKTENSFFVSNALLNKRTIALSIIAAASGLHTYLSGPPGCGKSFCADFICSLVPQNPSQIASEVSMIHSAYGEYGEDGFFSNAPIRRPHHSSSVEGIIGGGSDVEVGDITLAHGGILFLDEAPEFKPSILQALREPMESGTVSITRVGTKQIYPANFQAILTSNLCPCGELGRKGGACVCSLKDIHRYKNRIGGALFDRIPIRILFSNTLETVKSSTFFDYEIVKKKIEDFRNELAKDGYYYGVRFIPYDVIVNKLKWENQSIKDYYQSLIINYELSTRAHIDSLRLLYTIIILSSSEVVKKEHIDFLFSIMGSSTTLFEVDNKKAEESFSRTIYSCIFDNHYIY